MEDTQLGPDEDAMIDRDLASPQFVSWTARQSAKHLLDLVSHLYPGSMLLGKAQVAYEIISMLDDEIEAT